jgi:uncharacterized protein
MRHLGMLPRRPRRTASPAPVIAQGSYWLRAPEGGILRSASRLGQHVGTGEPLGVVSDPFGARETAVLAGHAGIVIGRNSLPLVNEGDALFHVARVARPGDALAAVEAIADAFRDAEPG